jgi:hypothetical protein
MMMARHHNAAAAPADSAWKEIYTLILPMHPCSGQGARDNTQHTGLANCHDHAMLLARHQAAAAAPDASGPGALAKVHGGWCCVRRCDLACPMHPPRPAQRPGRHAW